MSIGRGMTALLLTLGAALLGCTRSSDKEDSELTRHADVASNRRLTAALNEPVKVAFDDVPLEHAIQVLSASADIPIELDDEALADAGVARDVRVTLAISDKSFGYTLDALLRPLGLGYRIEDERVIVTAMAAGRSKH